MSFFKKIFGGRAPENAFFSDGEPNIKFGRYSDSFKNEQQIEKWQKALALFKEKDYLNAYQHFFMYLKDKNADNVKITETNNKLQFEVYQGSKKISGQATNKLVSAEVKVVKSNSLKVAFMRKLMERNYNLKYSRFALAADNTVYMKFSTTAESGSPQKLYYALKEVAIQADKLDDLLINEFSSIENVDNNHITPLNEKERNVKIRWLKKYIVDALELVKEIGTKNDGDRAFILLSLAFKLDYLITPEGNLMDKLEKVQSTYYQQNSTKNSQEKIEEIIELFEEINNLSNEEISKELYQTKATFGVGTPTSHNIISDQIQEISKQISNAIENKNFELSKAICEYIAGYALFFYGMQRPTKRFFEFLVKILNYEYYEELGFQRPYYKKNQLNKSEITKRLNEINNTFKKEFPGIALNAGNLKFESRTHFAYSFLKEIQKLPYLPK